MNINLLIHTPSFAWQDITLNRAEALDDLILLQGKARDDENCDVYRNTALDSLDFQWGSFYYFWDPDFDFETINASWLSKYVQPMTGGIIDWIFNRSQSSNYMSVEDLDAEFQNDANAYLGIDNTKPRLVYDEISYEALKASLLPKIEPVNWSQIYNEIKIGNILPSMFKRLDYQFKEDITGKQGHIEQIHIHFQNGSALNLDGSWKHKPTKEKDKTIPTEAQKYLLGWGFKLPQ